MFLSEPSTATFVSVLKICFLRTTLPWCSYVMLVCIVCILFVCFLLCFAVRKKIKGRVIIKVYLRNIKDRIYQNIFVHAPEHYKKKERKQINYVDMDYVLAGDLPLRDTLLFWLWRVSSLDLCCPIRALMSIKRVFNMLKLQYKSHSGHQWWTLIVCRFCGHLVATHYEMQGIKINIQISVSHTTVSFSSSQQESLALWGLIISYCLIIIISFYFLRCSICKSLKFDSNISSMGLGLKSCLRCNVPLGDRNGLSLVLFQN